MSQLRDGVQARWPRRFGASGLRRCGRFQKSREAGLAGAPAKKTSSTHASRALLTAQRAEVGRTHALWAGAGAPVAWQRRRTVEPEAVRRRSFWSSWAELVGSREGGLES